MADSAGSFIHLLINKPPLPGELLLCQIRHRKACDTLPNFYTPYPLHPLYIRTCCLLSRWVILTHQGHYVPLSILPKPAFSKDSVCNHPYCRGVTKLSAVRHIWHSFCRIQWDLIRSLSMDRLNALEVS